MTKETADIIARFSRAAAEWDSNPTRVALARAVTDAILAAVPVRPGMDAMDFGAGTGLVTLGLLPHMRTLTAVDTSPDMLKVLQNKLAALGVTNVKTIACEIGSTSLPASGFDLITSSMVLHHISDIQGALRHLRPCLRPGGWIALADLDTEDGTFHPDPTGVFHNGLARADVARWLEEAGFSSVTTGLAYCIRRPTASGQNREYPVFLITARA